jgi:hypothetical protein
MSASSLPTNFQAAGSALSQLSTLNKGLEYASSLKESVTAVNAKQALQFCNILYFKLPANNAHWTHRVRQNLTFFRTCYAILFGCVAAYEMLHDMVLLSGFLFLIGGWWFFIDFCHLIGRTEAGQSQKFMVMGPATVVVVLFTGMLSAAIWVVIEGSCLTLAHASLHRLVDGGPEGQELKPMTGDVEHEPLLRSEFGDSSLDV